MLSIGDTDKQRSCCGRSKEILLENLFAPVEGWLFISIVHSTFRILVRMLLRHLCLEIGPDQYSSFAKMMRQERLDS